MTKTLMDAAVQVTRQQRIAKALNSYFTNTGDFNREIEMLDFDKPVSREELERKIAGVVDEAHTCLRRLRAEIPDGEAAAGGADLDVAAVANGARR